MRVLFSGDSITKGQQGVSYVKIINNYISDLQITNIAENGESLNMIQRRLINNLKRKSDYDCIVLAGGLADVAIDSFLSQGLLFRFAYWSQKKIGMKLFPSAADFKKGYQDMIDKCKEFSNANLIIVTLNCAGENLNNIHNSKRAKYNEVIRQLAFENDIYLADAAIYIDEELKKDKSSDYFCGSFWKITYSDKLICLFKAGADWLAKKRGLKLTIDGIHINTNGANIFANTLIPILKDLKTKK